MRVFDLRTPLGYLFITLGILLVSAGLTASAANNTRSLGININAIWGTIMVGFGIVSLALAMREARRRRLRGKK